MTDPGAEMKARARETAVELLDGEGWDQATLGGESEVRLLTEKLAAFAAKEVARSEKVAMAIAVLLRAKCSKEEWEAYPDEITSFADNALAEATTREREACAKAVCEHCRNGAYESPILEGQLWIHIKRTSGLKVHCWAHAIHSRSQMKGEG